MKIEMLKLIFFFLNRALYFHGWSGEYVDGEMCDCFP